MAVEDQVETTHDVVDLLLGQHQQIRDLFIEVQSTAGAGRRDAFARLVRLLAVHETAEEEVVHPLARTAIAGGDGVVDDRLAEEREAKEVLSRLEELDPDSEEFGSLLDTLRMSVLEHAHHEEVYEFRYLRQHYDADRLRTLATALRAAEKTAPTHPHPGAETATENLVAGPVLAVFDRARDTLRKAMSDKE
ncbi:hemerythrin domain-containing protein [Actinophytocola glycyrrhizae]|uniref:Hemerythrin domain-containing protein n=1 Tax=Actinophytocola glycyrrhizae TaxID=2044873 RepID=A0ABV9RWB9_9PSEU